MQKVATKITFSSQCKVKEEEEEEAEIYTLKSIGSQQHILQTVPCSKESVPRENKSGYWTAKEHLKYVMFVHYFEEIFSVKHNKKLWKIYTLMAEFVKSRNSSQCRSHHQKLERKHRAIRDIVEEEREKYPAYDSAFEKMKITLEKLPVNNPAQVVAPKQTILPEPSIKVLEESVECRSFHRINGQTSLGKIPSSKDNQKSSFELGKNSQRFQSKHKLVSKKTHKTIIRTSKSLGCESIRRQKYLDSECSIDIEEQEEEFLANQEHDERNSQNFQLSQPSCKDKDFAEDESAEQQEQYDNFEVGPGSQSQSNYSKSKDENLKRTADSDGLMGKKPRNNNYVYIRPKNKKSKSSIPSYEYYGEEHERPSGERGETQTQNNTEERRIAMLISKCASSPAASTPTPSESSWVPDQTFTQKSMNKSLFSGFVSSMSSNWKNSEVPFNNFTSFGNLDNIYAVNQNEDQNKDFTIFGSPFFCPQNFEKSQEGAEKVVDSQFCKAGRRQEQEVRFKVFQGGEEQQKKSVISKEKKTFDEDSAQNLAESKGKELVNRGVSERDKEADDPGEERPLLHLQNQIKAQNQRNSGFEDEAFYTFNQQQWNYFIACQIFWHSTLGYRHFGW